jgi:uncharacterized repeat protein (TIGR03803 family)
LKGCPIGELPEAGLILASDGNFYGEATACSTGDCDGTVFKVTPEGVVTLLHSFVGTDGSAPYGPLVEGTDGNLYGTTSYNPLGTVFKISKAGKFTLLHTFTGANGDGASPYGALVEGVDGSFYGTTAQGGSYQGCTDGCGTVFKVTPGGEFATIYQFCTDGVCRDGQGPVAGLVLGVDSNFYGTTPSGGTGLGTVFKITPAGVLTTLSTFASGGDSPVAGLVQGNDGNFYGTTLSGGTDNSGTVFKVTPNGTLTILYNFDYPSGAAPYGGLLQATSGVFYGGTTQGGDLSCGNGVLGCGVVYSLDTALGPFVAFVVPGGKVGQTGGILGQGFTGTNSVSLNGISATFTVVSDTFIKATVPARATTGYVTVTTPTGVLTSNAPFHVLP